MNIGGIMNLKKVIYILLGFISLSLGFIGSVIPFLPTVPFLMISAFFFSKSSDRLNTWFKSTKFYKNNLDQLIKTRSMTLKAKYKAVFMITILMGLGLFIMLSKGVVIGSVILLIIWLAHVVYFFFRVRTI